MEWQPIETAPKDESRVLLFAPESCSQIGTGVYWQGMWFLDDESHEVTPTHWMPLPEAPK